jgi:hypothetical protein
MIDDLVRKEASYEKMSRRKRRLFDNKISAASSQAQLSRTIVRQSIERDYGRSIVLPTIVYYQNHERYFLEQAPMNRFGRQSTNTHCVLKVGVSRSDSTCQQKTVRMLILHERLIRRLNVGVDYGKKEKKGLKQKLWRRFRNHFRLIAMEYRIDGASEAQTSPFSMTYRQVCIQ